MLLSRICSSMGVVLTRDTRYAKLASHDVSACLLSLDRCRRRMKHVSGTNIDRSRYASVAIPDRKCYRARAGSMQVEGRCKG